MNEEHNLNTWYDFDFHAMKFQKLDHCLLYRNPWFEHDFAFMVRDENPNPS